MIDIAEVGGFPPGVITEAATLDDIMVHMNKKGAGI
jgi:hypothetical protein